MKKILGFCVFLFCFGLHAQTTITGKVIDKSGYPLPSANILIVGTNTGTATNFEGEFTLTTEIELPFTINVSYTGFIEQNIKIDSTTKTIEIILEEGNELDEVVISASRTPERIFESPVTIERFGAKQIRNTPSADFYSGLENLKGVDVNVNSLTFKSINTRGFADFGNTRFMQLVDGMDNSTPALNFPIGNLVGLTETDVQSVELLPGASSALYGANAFNGILLMRSKNPFDYEGISASVKQGFTSQEAAGTQHFQDLSVRVAKKFSDKFAAKFSVGYLKGTDWFATNESDRLNRGFTRENLDYDGVNVYGDEVSTNINDVAQTLESLGLAPNGSSALVPEVNVSRTGYQERELTNYNAESFKADWGLFYRPFGDDFEIQYVGKAGTGNTIYQGANRYNIKNFFQQQHKLEVKNDNFFVRGYLVADNAGDSYDMVFTGINVNRAWKDDQTWFGQYVGEYIGATLAGANDEQAHLAAREAADTGRLIPGTQEFQQAFDAVTSNPNLDQGGSQFKDESKYYHADANYNFKDKIDFAEVQVGGSFRNYRLNSSGTIYTDQDGIISYSEFGIYTQLQRNLELTENLDLKLTGSLRYDKSELFDGFFSPRLSAGITINENHNIRASFQTGFRNPTTQNLFIGLDLGRAILVGSAADNLERFSGTYPVSQAGQALGQPETIVQTGAAPYTNSFTQDLEVANPDLAKPEQVQSFEIGYRGKINKITIDASTYYNTYTDFLAQEIVLAPLYGTVGDNSLSLLAMQNGDFQAYQAYTNSDVDINSYGAAIEVSTKVFNGFNLSTSYTWSRLDYDFEANPDVRTNFNTPEHQFKASFGKEDLFENFGFNVAWRWSDNYFWESNFGDGDIPSFNVLDAQISYNLPKYKTDIKLGAANLLAEEYFTAIGTPLIGSQYYISFTINNL